MASFQAKIGRKRLRKRKNKIILSFRSYTVRDRNSKNITKKFKKLKNTNMNTSLAKIGWKCMRKREIKIIVSFLSYLTRNRKFQKNRKKFKKLKNTIVASFQAKIGRKRLRKRENKNYPSIPFLHGA